MNEPARYYIVSKCQFVILDGVYFFIRFQKDRIEMDKSEGCLHCKAFKPKGKSDEVYYCLYDNGLVRNVAQDL